MMQQSMMQGNSNDICWPRRIAWMRKVTGLDGFRDRAQFAARFGVARQTVWSWEEGKRQPTGAARLLLNAEFDRLAHRERAAGATDIPA